MLELMTAYFFFFFQAEDGIRDLTVTGVQTCDLPISKGDGWRAGDRDPVWVAVVAGLDLDGIAVDRRRRRDDRFADFGVPHAALGSSELRPEQLAQDRPGDPEIGRASCRERV